MTYREIIQRVASNLGMTVIDNRFVNETVANINYVMNDVLRSVNAYKVKTIVLNVDENTNSIDLHNTIDDYFAPKEVYFRSDNNFLYYSAELYEEVFAKWTPSPKLSEQSFNVFVTGEPLYQVYTEENFLYDGMVGYKFTTTYPQLLVWKPTIKGTIEFIYIARDYAITEANLDDNTKIDNAFVDLIIEGVTLKKILQKLMNAKTEVEYIALRDVYKNYEKNYERLMNSFGAFLNRKSTDDIFRIEPFEFLNDPDMLL